jgi:hypothetical protein
MHSSKKMLAQQSSRVKFAIGIALFPGIAGTTPVGVHNLQPVLIGGV